MRTRPTDVFRIFVAGPIRDCGPGLATRLEGLERALKAIPGAEVHFVLFENDSRDDTLQTAQQFVEKRDDSTLVTSSGLDAKIPQREARLAHCRNALLDIIGQSLSAREASELDIYLPVDLDIEMDWPAITAKLEAAVVDVQRGIWSGIFPVSWPRYYDIHALRCEGWNSQDAWGSVRAARQVPARNLLPKWFWVHYFVNSKQIRMSNLRSLGRDIRVRSAFGGCGVYRLLDALGHRYYSDPQDPCEHVGFHREMEDLALRTDFFLRAPDMHLPTVSRRRPGRLLVTRILDALTWQSIRRNLRKPSQVGGDQVA